jgi:multisubunit Na+/H+ antiporter MnhB subunit
MSNNDAKMKSTLILKTATRLLVGLILVFSVYLLLRGHNAPGGGFSAALVAATGFALFAISEGPAAVRQAIRIDPRTLSMVGLAMALGSGIFSLLVGSAFFTGIWWTIRIGDKAVVDLSTPLLFDTGVYLVVIGAVLTLMLALEEEIT